MKARRESQSGTCATDVRVAKKMMHGLKSCKYSIKRSSEKIRFRLYTQHHLSVDTSVTSLTKAPDEVDGGGRDGVEEEAEEEDEEEHEQDAQQLPLEVRPDDVLERLPRVHEPQEGRVGSAAQANNRCSSRFRCRCTNYRW